MRQQAPGRSDEARSNPDRPLAAALVGLWLAIAHATACAVIAQQQPRWQPRGPAPNTLGQVENISDGEVVGALNAVVLHPLDPDIAYVGAVNGGVWRTANARDPSPIWVGQTDAVRSLSIGALELDPTDTANGTLVAGVGCFSSYGECGERAGLLRTTDGGASWNPIAAGPLTGVDISGVAPRGSTIVVAASAGAQPGVHRSTDTGGSWVRVSGAAGSGLPLGASFDLASDPTRPSRLYTNAGGQGIFHSDDSGARWNRVSDATMNAVLSAGLDNVRIAVGRGNNVFVAIATFGRLAGLFRSGDGGASWRALDVPTTVEAGGATIGIHPGGQGWIHLSLAADPADDDVVYIGGDRQPCFTELQGCPASPPFPIPSFPNSLGAQDFSGRLFRVDASAAPGSQATALTHANTASRSAPHADSRDMAFDAAGDLIEVDDGGIYRRTSPRSNAGDWFSMNGSLHTTELHSIAWDAHAGIVIGGAQDTGTPEHQVPANARWRSVSTGDGGDVAVDDTSTPGTSIRYSSFQRLADFRRRTYDASNTLVTEFRPLLTVVGGNNLAPQFTTPVELNTIDPTRLIIGGANSVYESLDQGDTLTEIGPGIRVNAGGRDAIAYGAAGNPDMLYVGAGSGVWVRTAAPPAPLGLSGAYPGTGEIAGIAIDPDDPASAFVVDTARVYRTANGGTTWTDVTGNVPTLGAGALRTIAYVSRPTGNAIVIGGTTGVFWAQATSGFSAWSALGSGLPRVPVFDLDYDRADQILVAGTLGRGAWTVRLP